MNCNYWFDSPPLPPRRAFHRRDSACIDCAGTDRAYLRSWQALLNFQYTTPDYVVDKTLSMASQAEVEARKAAEVTSLEPESSVTVIAC